MPVHAHTYRHWLAIIVLLAVPLSGLGIDVISPSLPAIAHYYHVDKSFVQLSVTTYTLGFALALLFSGSLSDSLGRKKPFIVATIVYVLTSLLAVWSQTIHQLLVLRFVQGVAIGFLMIPIRAVISDLYEGKEFYKMIGYVAMAWTVGPIIAPAIGGYLQNYFSWKAPFWFLAIYGIVLLLLNIIFVPETLKMKQSFKMRQVVRSYLHMLSFREYIAGIICTGLNYAMIILFAVIAPFLIQNVLHYSALAFGKMALLMGCAMFLGNLTNRILIDVAPRVKISVSYWLMLVTVVIMLIAALTIGVNVYAIIIPSFILFYFGGLFFPNYYAQCLALFPHMAGAANGLLTALNVLIGSCFGAIATLLHTDTQIPLTLTFMVIVFIFLLVHYFLTPKTKKADN